MIELWTLWMVWTIGATTMVVPNLPSEEACMQLRREVELRVHTTRGVVGGTLVGVTAAGCVRVMGVAPPGPPG